MELTFQVDHGSTLKRLTHVGGRVSLRGPCMSEIYVTQDRGSPEKGEKEEETPSNPDRELAVETYH